LYRAGFPPVIIRNKGKLQYYEMLRKYDDTGATAPFETHLANLMLESLHRRIAYLKGSTIITVSEHARNAGVAPNTQLSRAKRQVIAAFRERGEWKIAQDA
jgi:hypothetical protein